MNTVAPVSPERVRVAIRLNDGDGLKPGDRVVVTGTHRLHDGQPACSRPRW